VEAPLVLSRKTAFDVSLCIWCPHDVESGGRGPCVAKQDIVYLSKRIGGIMDVRPAPDDLIPEILDSKDLVQNDLSVVADVPVQMNVQGAVIRQQLP